MLCVMFCHGVQSAPILKPFNLGGVEGVSKLGFPRRTILGVNSQSDGLTNGNFGAHEVDLVVWIDLIVILRINEC